MKGWRFIAPLAVPLALVCVFFAGWLVGLPSEKGGDHTVDDTIWTCSMHPQIRQPNSGLCPICAMDLIPLVPGGRPGSGRSK